MELRPEGERGRRRKGVSEEEMRKHTGEMGGQETGSKSRNSF